MITHEYRTYLIYHVDESLGVVPMEALEDVPLILIREDSFNQERKFILIKFAFDQKSEGCRIEVEKE